MTLLEIQRVVVGALPPLDLRWGPGLHAIVAPDAAAGDQIVSAFAGLARPRRGSVRLQVGSDALGKNPYVTPDVRRATGTLMSTEELAPGRSVEESVGRALALHQSALTAEAVLQEFGIALLSRRSPASLSRAEQRAVALALALSLDPVSLLVLNDPFATSVGRSRVFWALAERSRSAIVIVVTASLREARALDRELVTLTPSGLVPVRPLSASGPGTMEIVAAVSDPERLLTEIAAGPAEAEIAREASAGSVVLRGSDGDLLARELLRASVASSVTITRLSRRAASGHPAAPAGGIQ